MKKMNTKLKRDDQVELVAGKDRGKTGKILRLDRRSGKVLVEGLNQRKKTVRPKKQGDKGGIIDIEAPLDISNVMIVCKKCGKSRIGIKQEKKAKKRICKKCGDVL